jgi:catechol 2,3-dioxygenase-like lactoylglutathione lyase family enzyme
MPGIKIETIDHISLPVAVGETKETKGVPLEKSKEFYREILGLKETGRPEGLKERIKLGAWYKVDNSGRTLHLIANEDGESTFRVKKPLASCDIHVKKPLASRDIHFALRVSSYIETLRFLILKGYWLQEYRPATNGEADEQPDLKEQLDLKEMRVSPEGKAGFPQIFIMDPDRNVIELNVGNLLNDEECKMVEEELAKLKQSEPS